jgi:hypothetical protein
LYGFDGPKATTTQSKFTDADSLFKAFFSAYGFDNKNDSSFFETYFQSGGIKFKFKEQKNANENKKEENLPPPGHQFKKVSMVTKKYT